MEEKMKICIFGSYPPPHGGIARIVSDTTRILVEKDITFVIFTFSRNPNSINSTDDIKYRSSPHKPKG